MSRFSKLPRPVYDETFSSWLNRCTLHKYAYYPELRDLHVQHDFYEREIVYEDPDFDHSGSFFSTALNILRYTVEEVLPYFKAKTEWLLLWQHRIYFCPHCLNEDVASGRLPSWRKSWCYVTTTHCAFHRCQLLKFVGLPSIDKAWRAFSQHANNLDEWKTLPYRRWMDPKAAELRYLMTKKIRSWILKRSGQMAHINSMRSVDFFSYDSYICFKRVVEIFLQVPTRWRIPGLALHYFSSGRILRNPHNIGFSQALERGPIESNPHERMSAFLLAGWIMSLFSATEMRLIEVIFDRTHYSFPTSKYNIGCMALELNGKKEHQQIRARFYSLQSEVLSTISEFIEGIEKTYLHHQGTGEFDFAWKYAPVVWRRWCLDPYNELPLR